MLLLLFEKINVSFYFKNMNKYECIVAAVQAKLPTNQKCSTNLTINLSNSGKFVRKFQKKNLSNFDQFFAVSEAFNVKPEAKLKVITMGS